MLHATPNLREDHASQLPAILWLQRLGYQYLTPAQALAARGGKTSLGILDSVVRTELARLNTVRRRGQEFDFSPENLDAAVQTLRALPGPLGYGPATARAYDLLTLGESFQEKAGGAAKGASLRYIDWQNPQNNTFHVTAEFTVQRTGRTDTLRPDVVLFVNGLPLAVLECKRPAPGELDKAIRQQRRNQEDDTIRPLYVWTQLLLAADGTAVKYATTSTSPEFWATWREQHASPEAAAAWETELARLKNQPLSATQTDAVFGSGDFAYARAHFAALAAAPQLPTDQDRALWSLARPARLLELAWHYVLFENGQKKIARYQQFFGVRATLERALTRDADGRRQGGVVWHTQGSGKSLTMVLLAQLLASDPRIKNPKIVLVTDRTDLDEQIEGTFIKCGKKPRRAATGRELTELLREPRAEVITTIINKFDAAVKQLPAPIDDDDIFVLVDEGHRTQYGSLHVKMRQALPRACFIAFTGTPLLKREKSTAARFGGLIEPAYTIRQAVADGAVVPLLYEGRHAQQDVADRPLDRFFDVVAEPLTPLQRADLKRKMSRADQLNKTEQKIQNIALDISQHFSQTWRGTGLKGQLVTDSKESALRYKEALDLLGQVSSVVLFSAPDQREGEEDDAPRPSDRILRYWKRMMDKYGTAEKYQKDVINEFKNQDAPEIIIVVDKLLTGFDAPRNTVLYLTRSLKEHTLLQAVARVNRVYPGKDFGYVIDYYGNVAELNDALTTYGGLEGFDPADVADALGDIRQQVDQLPKLHAELWAMFQALPNRYDAEAYRQSLDDAPRRHEFYQRVTAYTKLLRLALSTLDFAQRTAPDLLARYLHDSAFFLKLREQAKTSYHDTVDYQQFEAQVQKLIDQHVSTDEVVKITELVNIFDEERFNEVVENTVGTAARADTIAHATAAACTERMDEDPALFRRLSELIRETIADYRLRRITEAEYLLRATAYKQQVLGRTHSDVPAALQGQPAAQAFFGLANELLQSKQATNAPRQQYPTAIAAGLHLDAVLRAHLFDGPRAVVDWPDKTDLVNRARLALDDYLFELNQTEKLGLAGDDIDQLLDRVFDVAQRQYA